jgi:diamine N-acetyltransferase
MKVSLRPLQESDAQTSVKWRNTPEIWEFTESRPDHEISLEEERAWIRRVMADPTSRRYAILADGHYVGNTYLTGLADGSAEYHIFIGERDFWGKGIARQATNQLLTAAKHEHHLKSVHLKVNDANAPAAGLYRSIGFTPAGREGDFTLMKLDLSDFKEESSHE